MIYRVFKVWIVLTLAAASGAQTRPDWVLREAGIGPVKIGMTKAQIKTALHDKLSGDDAGSESCSYLMPHKHPNLKFMINDGHLARIDVTASNISTSAGIRVGDTEARVIKAYGPAVKIDPHKYIDDGHYLTVRSKNGKYGIRFETDKGKVTQFYAGTFEAIQYVEGCL